MTLLELRHLEVAYGGIKAVKGIDLSVPKGELVCLIGTNGAGKTTTLKAIAGMLPVAAMRSSTTARRSGACALSSWCAAAWPWCRKAAACSASSR